jgi:hypothetical protein
LILKGNSPFNVFNSNVELVLVGSNLIQSPRTIVRDDTSRVTFQTMPGGSLVMDDGSASDVCEKPGIPAMDAPGQRDSVRKEEPLWIGADQATTAIWKNETLFQSATSGDGNFVFLKMDFSG